MCHFRPGLCVTGRGYRAPPFQGYVSFHNANDKYNELVCDCFSYEVARVGLVMLKAELERTIEDCINARTENFRFIESVFDQVAVGLQWQPPSRRQHPPS